MFQRILSLGSLLLLGVSLVAAQSACPVVENLEADIARARDLCGEVAANTLCSREGQLALADTERIEQTATDESLAITVLTLDYSSGTISGVLYGSATLENRVVGLPVSRPELSATNSAGYDVNLRSGAGTTFAEVGTLAAKATVTLDGRSADSQWVRVLADSGAAWVKVSLLKVAGDLSTLVIVDSPYTEPYQAMLLTTDTANATECNSVRGGLLLQQASDSTTRLSINDAELSFTSATVLVQAPAVASDDRVADTLMVQVLEGEATLTVGRTSQLIRAGEAAEVALDPATQLAVGNPQLQAKYAFANVANTPLALLPIATEDLCITGVPLTGDERETRGGPGEAYSAFDPLDNQSHYDVDGYATDEAGRVWVKLANGRWTPALNNDLVGACSGYVEVAAPPIGVQASQVQNQNISLVPTQNVRYQAYSGSDVMSGQCSTAPIAVCDHLAVVVPNGDGTIGWRGQEPITYQMTAAGQNRFVFNGRNFQNNANLALDLTFANGGGWTMTMTTVFDSDPTCTHTFYYSGSKLS